MRGAGCIGGKARVGSMGTIYTLAGSSVEPAGLEPSENARRLVAVLAVFTDARDSRLGGLRHLLSMKITM